MSPWLFNVYMDGVIKEMKMGMRKRGESGDYLFSNADDLVLCGESGEDLRGMVGWFVEVCRRGLKVIAGKSKVMVLNREKGLEYEVYIYGIHLNHVLEFIYLGYVLDEAGTDGRKVVSGRRMAGAIRSLVNARDLQLG